METDLVNELLKKGLSQNECNLLIAELTKIEKIRKEDELYGVISKLDSKYKPYNQIIEIYLRHEYIIPYTKITHEQACKLFILLAGKMRERDRKTIVNFLLTKPGVEVRLDLITKIILERLKKGNMMECLTFLYFVESNTTTEFPENKNIDTLLENESKEEKNTFDVFNIEEK